MSDNLIISQDDSYNDDDINPINRVINPISTIPYILSQFSWIIFIGFFIASGFIFPRYHPSQLFISETIDKPWNSSKDPIIFTHASDIHLSIADASKIITTRALINSMKFYKSDFNLISGDMVDSYGKKAWPKIGHQVEEDWIRWRKIVEVETRGYDFPIIDLAGNHEMWGIDDPLGPHNLFLDYSFTYNRNNTKTLRDFHVKTIRTHNLTFLLINLYRFPSVHPPYIYWGHPSREILDEIEDEIDKIKEPKFYVVCHYPIDHCWWIKSSRGHTFEQIMQNQRIFAYFTGHYHPLFPQVVHHGQGAVEYVGPGAYQFKAFGLVTIDNDRFVYHYISLEEPPSMYFITNPIPIEQMSSHQKFSEMKTELRVLAYEGSPETVLKVKGAVEGQMKYERTLPNGAHLFTLPLEFELNGIYTVNIIGENCNISRTFYIGSAFMGEKEVAVCAQRGLLFLKIAAIPIFLCLFWILFPYKMHKAEPNGYDEVIGLKGWLKCIFLSPSILRRRIQQLPDMIRYLLFAFLLYPLFLPNHFFKPIYGFHGCSFLCFIIINKTILYDEWALHMTLFYLLGVIIPSTILASSFQLFKSNHPIFYFNAFFAFAMFCGINVVNYRWTGESVIVPNLFFNPTFVIIPTIIYTTLFLRLFYRKPRNNSKTSYE
ncbi:Transmembrane protein 62 [Tritrichomonas musculus]|uniref:Transmembrane protein 62 n=1 Tax=Tritrichomonas musculus TaxID=1915356 RepID=A0ABR2L3G3_9EUKA